MKKLIALLLSLLFVLAACTEAADESSSDSNASETSQSGSLSGDMKKTVISKGAFYQSASLPSEAFPDSFGSELTNGADTSEVVIHTDDALVGYSSGIAAITIDLGESYDKIYGFAVHYFAGEDAGFSKKINVDIAVSKDNIVFNPVAYYNTTDEPEANKVNVSEFIAKKYLTGRYIRFKLKGDQAAAFFAELEVFADVEPKPNISYVDRVNGVYENLGVINPPADGEKVNREFNKVLISKGSKYNFDCDYTFVPSSEEGAPTEDKVLTDGVMSGKYKTGSYVSINGDGKEAKITVDLGRTTNDIGEVQAYFMSNPTSRIYLPLSVKVAAIGEDNKRTDLGVLYGTQVSKVGGFTFVLPLENQISARYIEFSVTTLEGMVHLVEEVAVYAFRDGPEQSVLYPAITIEKGEAAEKDGATSEYKNLIFNKTQQIFMPSNGNAEENAANNTQSNSPLLTDGKYSISGPSPFDIHNGKFFKFNAGDIRYIIYDLNNLSALDTFKGSFCKEISWGIQAPEAVKVILSANGEDWYDAGSFALSETQYTGIVRGELKLDKKVQARYVVFAFPVSQWVGCDELEVYGTEAVAGSVTLADSGLKPAGQDENTVGQRIEPSADLLDGAKDLCLLYQSSSSGGYTADELLPYVAYIDEEANIKDTMFDSFLFLHANSPMPSGQYPYQLSNKSDWQWCIDDLFNEARNLNALEEAAGTVKSALGLDASFTYKITVSINYPNMTVTDFGDVDGDGVTENLTTVDGRVKVCKWFIDEVNRRFAEANFQNIKLVGFYWWHEQIDSPSDTETIKKVAEYLHSMGTQFTWIPYFNSAGYDTWKELGFDVACLQPNYVFKETAPLSNIYNVDEYTKDLGMGIEMEIDDPCLNNLDFFKRYMKYVSCGAELGYMDDTVVMYYQGFNIFGNAANSGTYFGRTIYDSTYHFIKGDLKNVPDTIEGVTAEGEANGPISGKIELPEDKICEIELVSMPENGTVVLANDGTFTFYPAKDFKGEATFEFRYTELLSWSAPCTVTITVK